MKTASATTSECRQPPKGVAFRCPLAAAHRPFTPDPDAALMLQVQRDEPEAFAELVRRYWIRVFGRFYRQLGDRQEAEDLVQDVFLRLYRARKRYRPTAKFATWLYHISQNVARNALRTRRRHPCIQTDALRLTGDDPVAAPFLRPRFEAPSRRLERAELAGAVRAAVSGLARRQRTALELHQFHDHTYSQVAAAMDMTPKAAKSLLYRARLQLRASLSKMLEVEG